MGWMRIRAVLLILATMICGIALAGQEAEMKDPLDSVSPNIGGIGQLLSATVPYVQHPHGMARIAPITTPDITDRYLAESICGFPAGPAMLMTSTGDASPRVRDYASEYDHDFETATPYRYSVDLQSWKIDAELTASQAAAVSRFTFPAAVHGHLALSLEQGSSFTVVGDRAVQGEGLILDPIAAPDGHAGKTQEYFYAEFSKPFHMYQTWTGEQLSK